MAAEKNKKIEDKLKTLNSQQVHSDEYRQKLVEQKEELQRQKNRVWQAAYGAQTGLIRWPETLNHLNGAMDKNRLYFGDPINDGDRTRFSLPDVYMAEFNRLPEIIAPTEFVGKDWKGVLRHVDEFKTLPTPEEAWLALEDLCVQREVLRDIRAVNEMVADFLPEPQPIKEPAKPKGQAAEEKKRYQEDWARYLKDKHAFDEKKKKIDDELTAAYKVKPNEFAGRFISPYWQLDVVVGRPAQGKAGELDFRGKLTNTSSRRQNVAEIDFKLWMMNRPNADYVMLPVQAEFLAAGESTPFEVKCTGSADPILKIYKVEQKLNPKYVPVKQVVKLELGYRSHRFANKSLVASAFSDDEIKKVPTAPPADGWRRSPDWPGRRCQCYAKRHREISLHRAQ